MEVGGPHTAETSRISYVHSEEREQETNIAEILMLSMNTSQRNSQHYVPRTATSQHLAGIDDSPDLTRITPTVATNAADKNDVSGGCSIR